MLAAPAVDSRISRRCASKPRKNGTGFDAAGLLQDAATNSELRLLRRQLEMIGRGIDR